MKLLMCKSCQDVFKLDATIRSCKCGLVSGLYLDDLNAVYSGDEAIPLGFSNSTLFDAINNQPKEGLGERFTAFVIPEKCETMKKETIK